MFLRWALERNLRIQEPGVGVGRHGGKFGSESVLQGHGEGQGSKGDVYRFPIVDEQLGLCISFLWLL